MPNLERLYNRFPDRFRTPGRWAVRVVLGVFGLWLLWLVIVNVLLMTPLLQSLINDSQEDMDLSYDSAWALWPHHVHVSGLRLDIHDSSITARLTIEEAVVDIEVRKLLDSEFRALDIDATTTTFWLRRNALRETYKAEDPGLPPLGPFPTSTSEPEKDSGDTSTDWRLNLDIKRVAARDIWIDAHRVEGPVDITTGALNLHFSNSIAAQADVEVGSSTLKVANKLLVSEVSGKLSAELRESDTTAEELAGKLLGNIVGHGTLVSKSDELTAANHYISGDTAISGGSVVIRGDWGVESGKLTERTDLVADLKDVRVLIKGVSVGTEGSVSLKVQSDQTTLLGKLTGGSDADIRVGVDGELSASGSGFEAMPTVTALKFKYDVSSPSLEALKAWLGKPDEDGASNSSIELQGGSANAKGTVDWKKSSTTSARMTLSASDLAFRWLKVPFVTDLKAELNVSGKDGEYEAKEAQVSLDRLSYEESGKRYWNANVKLYGLRFDEGDDSGPQIRFTSLGKLTNANPIVELAPLQESIPDLVVTLTDLENLNVDAGLFRIGEKTEVKLYCASTDGVSVRGRLLTDAQNSIGAFYVSDQLVSVGVEIGATVNTTDISPGSDFARPHFETLGQRGLEECDNP